MQKHEQHVSTAEDDRADFDEDEEDGQQAGRCWEPRSGSTRHGRGGFEKRDERCAHARGSKRHNHTKESANNQD
jgi:hypothetical protein